LALITVRWQVRVLPRPSINSTSWDSSELELSSSGYANGTKALIQSCGKVVRLHAIHREYARNAGLHIDHILFTPDLAKRLKRAQVDTEVRGWEKTSDHAPVWIELKGAKAKK
jgi:exonuclease III